MNTLNVIGMICCLGLGVIGVFVLILGKLMRKITEEKE